MVPTQNRSAGAPELGANDQSSLSLPIHLVLEITRGRTRFRRRPVTSPRFLIGSGATCDLRLGGDAMPALHSIITISGNEISLEAIAAEPRLILNGRPVQSGQVHDGDLIGIGEVELLARLEAGQAPAGAAESAGTRTTTVEDERENSELSAAELVDRIEREQHEVDDFERRQRVAAEGLLAAVMGRLARPATATGHATGVRAPVQAPHFLSKRPQILAAQARLASEPAPILQREVEDLGRQLTSLSQEMQGNSQRASEREAHYVAAADQLLDTQERLVSQLEAVIEQVQVLKAGDAPLHKPRAIA
jgi:Inner membrane component of T3SS, cytoplasmic domain